jgi:hypothetical protein
MNLDLKLVNQKLGLSGHLAYSHLKCSNSQLGFVHENEQESLKWFM